MDEQDNERRLWQSVLIQAIIDASNPETLEGRDAAAWIESSIGVTAQDFRFVCDSAGFPPEKVREFYRSNKENISLRSLIKIRNQLMKDQE